MEDLGYSQERARTCCSWRPPHGRHDNHRRVRSVIMGRQYRQQQVSDRSVQNVAVVYSCILIAIIVENALGTTVLWIFFNSVRLGGKSASSAG